MKNGEDPNLTNSYAGQAYTPGLFQDPLWFVQSNSDQKKNEKEREGNEAVDYLELFFSHASLAPVRLILLIMDRVLSSILMLLSLLLSLVIWGKNCMAHSSKGISWSSAVSPLIIVPISLRTKVASMLCLAILDCQNIFAMI